MITSSCAHFELVTLSRSMDRKDAARKTCSVPKNSVCQKICWQNWYHFQLISVACVWFSFLQGNWSNYVCGFTEFINKSNSFVQTKSFDNIPQGQISRRLRRQVSTLSVKVNKYVNLINNFCCQKSVKPFKPAINALPLLKCTSSKLNSLPVQDSMVWYSKSRITFRIKM